MIIVTGRIDVRGRVYLVYQVLLLSKPLAMIDYSNHCGNTVIVKAWVSVECLLQYHIWLEYECTFHKRVLHEHFHERVWVTPTVFISPT